MLLHIHACGHQEIDKCEEVERWVIRGEKVQEDSSI
jgi:hypothetical protein